MAENSKTVQLVNNRLNKGTYVNCRPLCIIVYILININHKSAGQLGVCTLSIMFIDNL